MGPDYQRPEIPTPAAWRNAAPQKESLADLHWWELFRDPQLRGLIEIALLENKDLRIAIARIDEARALLGVAQADYYPQVDASLSAGSDWSPAGNVAPGASRSSSSFQVAGQLSYEADLWGRVRRANEAGVADLLAREHARRAIELTLICAVAGAYLELVDLDEQLAISKRTVDSRQQSYKLVSACFKGEVTNELDVRQAEMALAGAQATIPELERQIVRKENELSLLLGRNPGAIPRGKRSQAPVLPPKIPAGLPSALLLRRPDIREAEHNLIAANAGIGEAKAAFFPSITITGGTGVASGDLSTLFSDGGTLANFAGGVTQPLFDGARIIANYEASQAVHQRLLVEYAQTIQEAFGEVEDALIDHAKAREQRLAQQRLATAAQRAAFLARRRYEAGVSSYLDVLDAERELFDAELALSQSLRAHLVAVVELYRALGGGWKTRAAHDLDQRAADPEAPTKPPTEESQ